GVFKRLKKTRFDEFKGKGKFIEKLKERVSKFMLNGSVISELAGKRMFHLAEKIDELKHDPDGAVGQVKRLLEAGTLDKTMEGLDDTNGTFFALFDAIFTARKGYLIGFNTHTPLFQKIFSKKFSRVFPGSTSAIALSKDFIEFIRENVGDKEFTILMQEYIFHEMICPLFGHEISRLLQCALFPENYYVVEEYPEGFLAHWLRRFIDTGVPPDLVAWMTEIGQNMAGMEMAAAGVKKGLTETIKKNDGLIEQINRYIGFIDAGISSAGEKLNDMRNILGENLERLSRMGKDIGLSLLVNKSVEKFKLAAPDVEFRVSLSPGIKVGGIQAVVGYILDELFQNSVKYKSGRITIKDRKEEDSVEVSVEDDGMGISSERLKDILRKTVGCDERVEKGKSGGTGLFYLNQLLFSYAGEEFTISSEGEGNGTKVRFHLPFEKEKYKIPDLEILIDVIVHDIKNMLSQVTGAFGLLVTKKLMSSECYEEQSRAMDRIIFRINEINRIVKEGIVRLKRNVLLDHFRLRPSRQEKDLYRLASQLPVLALVTKGLIEGNSKPSQVYRRAKEFMDRVLSQMGVVEKVIVAKSKIRYYRGIRFSSWVGKEKMIRVCVNPVDGRTLAAENRPGAMSIFCKLDGAFIEEADALFASGDKHLQNIVFYSPGGENIELDGLETEDGRLNLENMKKIAEHQGLLNGNGLPDVSGLTVVYLEREDEKYIDIEQCEEMGIKLMRLSDADIVPRLFCATHKGYVYAGRSGLKETLLLATMLRGFRNAYFRARTLGNGVWHEIGNLYKGGSLAYITAITDSRFKAAETGPNGLFDLNGVRMGKGWTRVSGLKIWNGEITKTEDTFFRRPRRKEDFLAAGRNFLSGAKDVFVFIRDRAYLFYEYARLGVSAGWTWLSRSLGFSRKASTGILLGIAGSSNEVVKSLDKATGGVKLVALNEKDAESNLEKLREYKNRYGAYASGMIEAGAMSKKELKRT
ncbi:MAG: ATP-binding protein, partial [Candidatus Omnitrophica bacterium]|nr:ATP-binding protein [Candidatus Omnitrophota bacterium]